MLRLLLYIIVIPIVVWSADSLNFNAIFKKGNVDYYRARVFYIIFIFVLSYLVVSFLYDFLGVISLWVV